MERKIFDVIVLGVGSMGVAACYHVSRAGASVLGLEQFAIPHERGSHGGQSRIIRQAYFEHPDYVPLLKRAYHNWQQLEHRAATHVYHPTGLLYAAPPGHFLISGTQTSAARYNVALQTLAPSERHVRFPAFQLPHHYDVLVEPEAGLLLPHRCLSAYKEQALLAGAVIKEHQRVWGWQKKGNEVVVITAQGEYRCRTLVITAGAWAGQVLPSLASSLRVTRQVIAWVQPQKPALFQLGSFPCWLIAHPALPGSFYGFPVLPHEKVGGPAGLKIAYHHPGRVVEADEPDRGDTQSDVDVLMDALNTYLPLGCGQLLTVKTCLYTSTPDEHFVIDFLPDMNHQVVVAAGFSGHGFKFVSVVGEVLSDLALQKKTDLPIGFLGLSRLARAGTP